MLVLLAFAATGAWVAGPVGAVVGYVLGMVVGSFLPDPGGACSVERPEPKDDSTDEQDADAA